MWKENLHKQDMFYYLCCLEDVRRLEPQVWNGSEDLQVQVWRKKEREWDRFEKVHKSCVRRPFIVFQMSAGGEYNGMSVQGLYKGVLYQCKWYDWRPTDISSHPLRQITLDHRLNELPK